RVLERDAAPVRDPTERADAQARVELEKANGQVRRDVDAARELRDEAHHRAGLGGPHRVRRVARAILVVQPALLPRQAVDVDLRATLPNDVEAFVDFPESVARTEKLLDARAGRTNGVGAHGRASYPVFSGPGSESSGFPLRRGGGRAAGAGPPHAAR